MDRLFTGLPLEAELLRDSNGNFIGGFSNFYGVGTNIWAKLHALGDGLAFRLALDISQVLVECHSIIVVNAARSRSIGNWRLEYMFRECMKLFSPSFQITHGFRQKNHMADRLAAAAHLHKGRKDFFRIEELPMEVWRALVADGLGLWNFRK